MIPTIFAQNLKSSNLTKEEQDAIINLLPYLTPQQLEEIDLTLKEDNKRSQDILKKAFLQIDVIESDIFAKAKKWPSNQNIN